MCPGSALRLHGDATVIPDEPAARKLTSTDYYRYTYDQLPQWQRFVTETTTGRRRGATAP